MIDVEDLVALVRNYNPRTNYQRALERRNYVLGEMANNGFISQQQAVALKASPIVTTTGAVANRQSAIGGYFIEEVRRQLIDKFGEDAESGPNSVYAGGLWVRTTIDPVIQAAAEKALRNGLLRYDSGRGWRGPGCGGRTGRARGRSRPTAACSSGTSRCWAATGRPLIP
mgnify:CR=1 FL=1